jgi:hypothetical protein
MSRPRARGIAAHATRSLPSGDSTSTCTSSCDAFTLGVVQPWPLRVTVWPGRTLVGWIWKVSLAGEVTRECGSVGPGSDASVGGASVGGGCGARRTVAVGAKPCRSAVGALSPSRCRVRLALGGRGGGPGWRCPCALLCTPASERAATIRAAGLEPGRLHALAPCPSSVARSSATTHAPWVLGLVPAALRNAAGQGSTPTSTTCRAPRQRGCVCQSTSSGLRSGALSLGAVPAGR